MATAISHGGINSGFQAGVIHGNVENVTFVQPETLNQACLRDLRTTNPLDDKERIKKTKGGLLKESYRWILENEEFKQWQNSRKNRLLWIRGDPGKGKTMLICGVIEELTRLYGENANISFFFCQAADMRINSATSVLRGLIYLLIEKHPSLLPHVRARYDNAGKALFEDVNAWNALLTIFRDILRDPTLQMTYFVIDALDECINGLDSLLDFIVQESITAQLSPVSLELNEASVSEAVNYFIQHKVRVLAQAKRYSDTTRDAVQRYLSSNSQGTFLWVALVCQNLGKIRTHVLKKLKLFPPGLDSLYSRMIDQVCGSEDAELCMQILEIMLTVFQPITLNELTSLIELPDDDNDDHALLKEIIAICGSFLILREHTIVFIHQSAKEFLLKEALDKISPGGIEAKHKMIFARSLDVIFKALRRDIYNIRLPGFPTKDISKPSPDPLVAVEYSCIYWVDHLQGSKRNVTPELSLYDMGRVDAFLQQKLLHWLEALSILGREESQKPYYIEFETPLGSFDIIGKQLRAALYKIWDPATGQSLFTLEGHSGSVWLIAWSHDGSRLASASSEIVIWDPATGQSLFTLEGHTGLVRSIAWAHDGSRLASASSEIVIWDPATGQSLSTLEGHGGLVLSIAWSHNGSRLASASDDKIVRIWDPATGQSRFNLEGHSNWVLSIAWSHDGSRLASSSSDKTIRIWDPATGQSLFTLEGHSSSVLSVAWSHDGSRLASASSNKTVRIWDPATGQSLSTLEGHSGSVWSIAWAHDGSRLASASSEIVIWDPATGQSLSTLEGHSDWVLSISWSQDGSRLASASSDKTVRIWDPATVQSLSTLEGHSGLVLSTVWSHDGSRLASASDDKIVRIWDPATGQSLSTLEGHSNRVLSIAWSHDGSRLASASSDKTVRIWDPTTGQSLSTLEGHSGSVWSVAWSHDGSQLASESEDKTVRIWDPATGQSLSTCLISPLQLDKFDLNRLLTDNGTFDMGNMDMA
ncbi:hypothetical protein N7495_006820 [Penicillium taxi]|uniref:uncharacterized protein n=1 Tax=Penicillium taxi TaxID=168475 RepID=UPI00254531F0|nr:uncharacterized protein N7495_006820 [Penicillium taxi]KAJ5895129.1 hypothetical protein N7495_006820 [Penicillium taxi]